ncbi:MAG: aminotransferase class IV [Nocardioides sp.]
MHAWVNGRLLDDPNEPAVPITDHGFTVGDGVFEAVKVVASRPFALERHLDRLISSAAGIGLPEPDLDAVRAGIDAVLAAEALPLGRLRITVTGGPSPLGSGRGGHSQATVAVVASSMEPAAPTSTAISVPWPRNERSAVAGLKTTSYAENVVALAYAARHGAAEAIFANLAGNLCEGTGSNVFYAVDGQLRTPTLASGCLAGVTRALVVEWCRADGMDVVEIDEPISILDDADEVFLASTTRDVQAVTTYNQREMVLGPVTERAARVWRDREDRARLSDGSV